MAKQRQGGWVKCRDGQWFNLATARAVFVRYAPFRMFQIVAVSGADVDTQEYEVREGVRVVDDYRGNEVIERPTVLAEDLPEDLARSVCDLMMMAAVPMTDNGYVDLDRIVRDARAQYANPARTKPS